MTHMVLSSVLGFPTRPPSPHGEVNGPTGSPRHHGHAHADVWVFRDTPLASTNPGQLEGAVTARRLHSQLDAVCGMAYLTRAPQGVASGLSKAPLEKTGHENSAPIGDGFPLEALGAFQALQGAGGAIETGAAIKNLSNTCQALSHRQATHAAFAQGQLALDEAHRRWAHSEAHPSQARRLCDAAKNAWQARASKVQLDTAMRHAPEQIVDVVRYTVVSWTSRLFSALKLAFKASAWLSLAASIVGIVGSAFQALAGIFKWHSSSKLVGQAKRALRLIESGSTAASPTSLQAHVIRHARSQRKDALQQARDKRTKARIETITGIAATLFSALAFLFPPLAFIAIATGLAYAGYRVYRGIRSFFSTRELNRRETAWRVDFHSPAFVETLNRSARSEGWTAAKLKMAAENPCYAIHCLIERIQQDDAAWLHGLLEQLGVSRPDRDAVFLLAQTHDVPQASHCLERMLFGGEWSPSARTATA
jgi:hypothetical protein